MQVCFTLYEALSFYRVRRPIDKNSYLVNEISFGPIENGFGQPKTPKIGLNIHTGGSWGVLGGGGLVKVHLYDKCNSKIHISIRWQPLKIRKIAQKHLGIFLQLTLMVPKRCAKFGEQTVHGFGCATIIPVTHNPQKPLYKPS